MTEAIRIEGLNKTFGRGGKAQQALQAINLTVQPGEMVALIGASGSGKSTLLRHIAGLVPADPGNGPCAIEVLGRCAQSCGRIRRGTRQERANIGFIFQQFNLISRLSVLTNVCLGLLGRISPTRGSLRLFTRQEKLAALTTLEQVGMARFAEQRACTLSGGQQQRVAIARTLVQQAQIILADEPIASLDPASSKCVMTNLAKINASGITVVVSLHQVRYAVSYCSRTLAMHDGQIVYDGPSKGLTSKFLTELYGEDSEDLVFGNEHIPNEDNSYNELEAAAVYASA